jgi:flagellar FliL protein
VFSRHLQKEFFGAFRDMKLIIIAAVAILLLGGGGAGAYFYFKHPAEAATNAAGEVVKAEREKKKHGGEEEKSSFVQLDPLILPIIGKTGLTETVSMVIVIETPNDNTKKEVSYMAPKLKDAFIQDMYGALTQEAIMKDGVIQVGALKTRLHEIGVKVLGEEMVSDVLLQVVQQRRM